jgi:hypothetical protein
MRMNRVLVLSSALMALGFGSASADDTQANAVRKMLAAKQTAIPTGIDVPGSTEYVLTERGVRQIRDPKDIKDPFVAKHFWAEREKRGAGSDGTSGQ